MYSRVPNKQTDHLLENEKKSHLYALIRNYTFINFQLKVLPIRLFSPIFILFFQICLRKYVSHWYMKQKKGFLRVDLGFLGLLSLCNCNYYCNYVSMYYSILLKSTYTFISFSENFPPIRLFSPILLLDFKKISHLYFY